MFMFSTQATSMIVDYLLLLTSDLGPVKDFKLGKSGDFLENLGVKL
jgi:hypothetical protein